MGVSVFPVLKTERLMLKQDLLEKGNKGTSHKR